MSRRAQAALLTVFVLTAPVPATAHETDHFTVPPGRQFADLGDTITRWAYRAIERGVNRTNGKIREAVREKRADEVKKLQLPDEVAANVNFAFPPALFSIEEWDVKVQSASAKAKYPGRVVGYKPFIGVRRYAEFSLDPFRAWNCATIYAYGTYLGTDKLGHFSDMGKHYYRRYREALAEGKDEERAMRSAINLGTDGPLFFSESGLLGEKTAGAYSNADLVANYCGMLFYRNLTDEITLKGQRVPPMLERDGEYWKVSERIRPDSDFFALFISDHLDEALNPSRYVSKLRDKIRQAIEEHASETIDRYVDAHGNRRPRAYFQQRLEELKTYWGVDYGHKGNDSDLLTIANTCFPAAPQGMKPDVRDAVGMTPMHHAARDGDANRLRELMRQGGDVNAQVRSREKRSPEWGSTPLHYAVRDGHDEVVRLLLDSGADVNAANDRRVTPLHRAIMRPEIMKKLLDAGARADAPDEDGQTPLHWAALDGAPEAVAVLLERGAANVMAVDHRERTPLHVAAEGGGEATMKALLARGANADVADGLGVTPLHLASRNGATSLVSLLLDAGAAPNAQDNFGVTPLHEATRRNVTPVVSRLLAANADPALRDFYGATPLHLAARYGREPVARLLLDAGADAQVKAGTRGTAIDVARRLKNRPVLAVMREAEEAAASTASYDAQD